MDQTALLVQEYLQLQKTVEDFDSRALTIKAWSVTFSAAGLGLAYQQGNPTLLLVAAGSALVFWVVEAVWKSHQRAYYPRIAAIEEHFRAISSGGLPPLQILASWRGAYGKGRFAETTAIGRLAVPFFGGVLLPHVIVAAAGIYLYFYAPEQARPKAPTSALKQS